MTNPGEPVGDAGALLGNLLEDSGASVADDVVVALHVSEVAYTGRLRRESASARSAFFMANLPSPDAPAVGFEPSRVLGFLDSASSKAKGLHGRIGLFRFESQTVQFKKQHANGKTHPLIAVHERMVLHQAKGIARREREYRRLLVGEEAPRPGERRLQQSTIPKTCRTTVKRQQLLVECQDGFVQHPDGRLHFAS